MALEPASIVYSFKAIISFTKASTLTGNHENKKGNKKGMSPRAQFEESGGEIQQ